MHSEIVNLRYECKGCSESLGKNKMLLCLCKKYSDEYKLVKGIEKRGEECLCGK